MRANQVISKALAYFLAFAMILQPVGAVYAETEGESQTQNEAQTEQQLDENSNGSSEDSGQPTENAVKEYEQQEKTDTVKPLEYKSETFQVRWNDNMDVAEERPEAETFSNDFALYFSLDGGEPYTELTDGNLSELGIDNMPEVTIDTTSNRSIWTYSYDGIPSKIGYIDSEGKTGDPIEVSYRMQYKGEDDSDSVSGYATPVYKDEDNKASVTYTSLENWSADITWLDVSVSDAARPDIDETGDIYTLYRYVEGEEGSSLEELSSDMLSFVVNEEDDSVWDIKLNDAPAYDENGNPYVYYLVQADKLSKDKNCGEYSAEITNYDNYSNDTSRIFKDGNSTNLIENKTTYVAYKEWEDDNSNDRPATGLVYLYRIIEKPDRTIAEAVSEANPVQGFDNEAVPTGKNENEELRPLKDGNGEEIEVFEIVMGEEDGEPQLPMYDNRGNKYIYFGLETGIGGEYHAIVDNTTSDESKRIKDAFDEIKSTEGGVKYILNEGIITNDREAEITIDAGKLFVAQSMQSFENSYVKYKLQIGRHDADGNLVWSDANKNDIVSYDEKTTEATDSMVTITIDGFCGEAMGQNCGGTVVNKYDKNTGAELEYRWVEMTMSINGGNPVDVYDKDGNKVADTVDLAQDENGNVLYSETNVGDVGPGVTGEDGTKEMTTALFQPQTISNNNIKNVLVGDLQIKVRKTWYDETGNISGDAAKLTGVSVEFVIRRNDGKTTDTDNPSKKLIDANGEPVDNVVLTIEDLNGGSWIKMQKSLQRYDENGEEYTYKIVENEIADPQGRQWSRDWETEVSVQENADGSGEMVPEIYTKHDNTVGPEGGVIWFDIEKQWLDDVDLLSRKFVVAGVYRKGYDGWTLVKTAVLNEHNEWMARVSVNKTDESDNPDNYLVKEIAVGNVTAEYISFDKEKLDDDAIKAAAKAGVNDYDYESRVGIVAEDDSYFDEAGTNKEKKEIDYNYNVYIEEKDPSADHAEYLITNQRVGMLNLDLTKTWNAGGVKYDAVFVLYRNSKAIDANEILDVADIDGEVEINDDGSIALTGNGVQENKIHIILKNLEKFDYEGVLYDYTLEERGIRKDGQEIQFKNRKATVDGDTYVSALARTSTDIKGKEHHHTGDVYKWEGSNTRAESYTLQANKVWRDDGSKPAGHEDKLTVRPDVCFNLYRVSLKDDDDLAELVERGDSDALADELSKYATSDCLVSGDHFWNTKHNDWFWSVDLGGVQRYDGEGYAYIYFIKEKYTGSAGKYSELYSNLNCREAGYQPIETPEKDNFTTKEVFGIESDRLQDSSSVTILSDGSHDNNGDYGTYYSATVVNAREDVRTISGKKIWHVPEGWSVPEENMPSVEVALYRFSTPITDASGRKLNEITQEQLDAKIKEEGADVINNTTLENGKYIFHFTKDKDGNELQKYDSWGRSWYYYISEKTNVEGYTEDKITFTSNNYSITNTYDPAVGPRTKVSVTKHWTNIADIDRKTANAPVEFSLYAIQQDEDGKIIGDKILIAKKAMIPDETGSHTIDFGSQPYLGTNEQPLKYWVEETQPNGYTCSNKDELVDGAYVGSQDPKKPGFKFLELKESGTDEDGAAIYSAAADYINDYNGGSIGITLSKTWDDSDNEMDNSQYRLEEIKFEIWRKWSTNTVDGVSQPGGDEFLETAILTGDDWKYTKSNLTKYAPNGKSYTYYIKADTETAEDENKLFSYTPTKNGNNVVNVLKTVAVQYKKSWYTSDGKPIDGTTFKRLVDLGAVPKQVQFLVQRSFDGENWSYVETNTNYGVVIEGKRVAGITYDVTADNYNKMSSSWDKLPMYELGTKNKYQYRAVERLIWPSGNVTAGNVTAFYGNNDANNDVLQSSDKVYAPETAEAETTVSDDKTVVEFKNTVDVKKVKLTKYWANDNGNRDDTRPDSVTLHVTDKEDENRTVSFTVPKPAQAGSKNSDGSISDGYHNSTGTVYIPTLASVAENTNVVEIAQAYTNTYTVTEDEIPAKEIGGVTYKYSAEFKKFKPQEGATSDGVFELVCTNSGNADARSMINISGTKNFSGDGDWYELTRPTVRLGLYFQDEKTGEWTKISVDEADKDKPCYYTNFFMNPDATPDDVSRIVEIINSTGTVEWTELKEYWERSAETAGEAQKIVYGLQEEMVDAKGDTLNNSSYESGYTDPVKVTEGAAEITNSLTGTADVSVLKIWKDTEGNNVDSKDVEKLVNTGVLPETITFSLKYMNGETAVDTEITKTLNVVDMAETPQKWEAKLPMYDKNGEVISYQVSEKSWTYAGDKTEYNSYIDKSIATETKLAELNDGLFKVELTNTFATKNVTVNKFWDDEEYRPFDKYVRPDIELTLTATVDGKTFDLSQFMSDEERIVTLTSEDGIDEGTWQYEFQNLPKYTQGGKEIDYMVYEKAIAGYIVDTECNDAAPEFVITNTPNSFDPEGNPQNVYTPVTANIKKVDKSSKKPLKGAIFEVTKDGKSLGTTAETGNGGLTSFEFAEPGTYIIKEVAAPAGYTLCKDEFKVVVEKSELKDYEYDEKTDTYTNYYDLYITDKSGKTYEADFEFVFKDNRIPTTGDKNEMLLWAMMFLLTGAGFVGAIARRRRQS